MKIKVNINKKSFIIIFTVILIITGILSIYAFSDYINGKADIMGHSADEVDVQIGGSTRLIQNALDELVGTTKCELTAKELRDIGCPIGTYLYNAKRVCSDASCAGSASKDAICTFFFSTVDNSASVPSCYGRGSFGGEICGSCNSETEVNNFCGAGSPCQICQFYGGTYRWVTHWGVICRR